jgi:hypothetical protein
MKLRVVAVVAAVACAPSAQEIMERQRKAEQQRQAELAYEATLTPVQRAKKHFMEAVEADRLFGGRFDMSRSVSRAEQEFMSACSACAQPTLCEADRLTVRRGLGSLAYDPCK